MHGKSQVDLGTIDRRNDCIDRAANDSRCVGATTLHVQAGEGHLSCHCGFGNYFMIEDKMDSLTLWIDKCNEGNIYDQNKFMLV